MQQLATSIIKAAELNAKLTGSQVSPTFLSQIKTWGAGIFRIVVMGEIKKGKSSFINALLGVKDLVPVASDVATSTIYKIHYGEQLSYRVHFEKQVGKEPLCISADELDTYGTENGNPGNVKGVDFIEVSHPSPILKTGIVIIDTPGLGGLFKEHKKITWQYVPRADAVFFVTDSVTSPIGLEEIEHLKSVLKITKHLYFVQTKAGAVDKDAREARRQNNLAILSQSLNVKEEAIPYFVVDSLRKFSADEAQNVKKLDRSGYPQVMQFVNSRLLVAKQHILANKMMQLVSPIIDSISADIEMRKETLGADSEAKQKQVKETIDKIHAELLEWKTEKLPELKKTMDRGFKDIQAESMSYCHKLRPNGEIQIQLDNMIDGAKDIAKLHDVMQNINDKLPSYASSCLQGVQNVIESRVSDLFSSMSISSSNPSATQALAVCTQEALVNYRENIHTGNMQKVLEKLQNADGPLSFDNVKTGIYGGMAGMTVCSIVGGIIGSVVPVVGTIAGSSLGTIVAGIWGGQKAVSARLAQELNAAQNQAKAAVAQSLSSIYSNITVTVGDILRKQSEYFSDTLEDAIKQQTQSLEKRKAEIENRGRAEVSKLQELKKSISADEQLLRSIMKSIEPWMNQGK